MKFTINALTGTEKQIAYAQDLLNKEIKAQAFQTDLFEEGAKDILANHMDVVDEVIASGALGNVSRSDVTVSFLVKYFFKAATPEECEDAERMNRFGQALEATDAHTVIELLK